jgi:CheY-like chemotaxis protein
MALKILIVDDEEPARQGLTALLARWGYDVEEAADGQDALAKAAAGLPAVVISDLVMPRMDGLELLRALKTDVPFASVILLTGQGSRPSARSPCCAASSARSGGWGAWSAPARGCRRSTASSRWPPPRRPRC